MEGVGGDVCVREGGGGLGFEEGDDRRGRQGDEEGGEFTRFDPRGRGGWEGGGGVRPSSA